MQYLIFLCTTLVWVGLAVAWQGYGIDGAGNVMVFLGWLAAVIRSICALCLLASQANGKPDDMFVINNVRSAIICGFFAFVGHFWLAGFYAFGMLCVFAKVKLMETKGE